MTISINLPKAVQDTDLQNDSIRQLAGTLREMLATANMVPDLPEIPNTTNVIEDIGCQSLRVASLIHEYTKLSLAGDSLLYPVKLQVERLFLFTERTVKIGLGDLKLRIDTCQKDCAFLKDRFLSRIHLDTNIQVKKMKDDKLGSFELLSSMT